MQCNRQGEQLAGKLKAPFLETSAKTRVNVTEVFHTLVREINKTREAEETSDNNSKDKGKKERRGCVLL